MKRSLFSSLTLRAGVVGLSLAVATPALAGSGQTGAPPTVEQLKSLAEEAFVFGYPRVLMEETKKEMTQAGEAGQSGRLINVFLHMTDLATPADQKVVRPNVDTLYSTAWLDLSAEPIVLRAPDTADRYYVTELLDAWTNVFAAPGKRTTGTQAKDFVLVGPDYQGLVPAGLTRIDAPTNQVWIINRIQVDSPNDLATVRNLQSQFRLMSLGDFMVGQTQGQGQTQGMQAQGAETQGVEMQGLQQGENVQLTPFQRVDAMDAETFLTRLAELLTVTKTEVADAPILARFQAIGLVPGQAFQSRIERAKLEEAKESAKALIRAELERLGEDVNGWKIIRQNIGTYGTNYLRRAAVAVFGLGANLPEDALYPMAMRDIEGNVLEGRNRYVIHFEPDALPPVDAFWSITLYNDQGLLVPNALERHAIRDRDQLVFNADGSLDIFIQNTSPGAEREANWLPAPEGAFNLLMRLYQPKAEVLSGAWAPAGIMKVMQTQQEQQTQTQTQQEQQTQTQTQQEQQTQTQQEQQTQTQQEQQTQTQTQQEQQTQTQQEQQEQSQS